MLKRITDNLSWIVPSIAIVLAATGFFDRSSGSEQAAVEQAPAQAQAQATAPAQTAVDTGADMVTVQAEPAATPEAIVAPEVTRNASLTAALNTVAAPAADEEQPAPQQVAAVATPSITEDAAAFFNSAQANLAQANSCVEDVKALADQARIYFPAGGLTVDEGGMGQARLIGLVAQDCPGVTIQVEGHSDPSGDPRINLQLSQQRAEVVISRLRAANIDTSNFVPKGFGDQQPSNVQGPESSAYYDRRVEFSVIETVQQASLSSTTATPWSPAPCVARLQDAVKNTRIFYAPGSITSAPSDLEAVYKLTAEVAACDQVRLRVIGQHAPQAGARENPATGRLRAIALMSTLVGAGFEPGQIIIAAPSTPQPIAGQPGLSSSRIDFDLILEDS